MMKASLLLFSLLAVTYGFLVPSAGLAQEQRYFPTVGKEAIHQRTLDLSGGAVVLSIALQPGYEDLTLLSRLRLGLGARTFTAYFTNGEATPSDLNGLPPQFVAGERQEEAYNATRLLGSQSYFLNFSDAGVLVRRESLARVWNPDSVLAKLVALIRSYNPDAVVVQGDFRGDSIASVRQQLLSSLVVRAAEVAGSTRERDTSGVAPWKIHRIFAETEPDPARAKSEYDRTHPLWKKSYRAIADEARESYQTLRFQLPSWLARGERTYKQIWPAVKKQPASLTAGLPVITGKVRPLARLVQAAAGRETRGTRTASLQVVSQAIDTVNYFLARERPSLSSADFRPVALWKNALEDLRCSLLHVVIDYSASDSLITQSQLVYLRFKGFSSKTSNANTQILFPGVMERKWGLNEGTTYQFPFTPPVEYRLITPQPLEFNMPAEQFGIRQPFQRTRFPFLLFHQDSTWGRDFIFRGELLFRSAPRRTFELLTPAIRAVDGAPVVVRMQNISRDAYKGTVGLSDSTIITSEKPVDFSSKDQVVLDTLHLAMRQPFTPGSSRVRVSLSGMRESLPVIVRSFEVRTDTTAHVRLLSRVENSPVADALRRLNVQFSQLQDLPTGKGSEQDVLVIDRDALTGLSVTDAQKMALGSWVEAGGRLVILPQDGMGVKSAAVLPWGTFKDGPLVEASDSLLIAPEDPLLTTPNTLREEDWQGWVVSRSQKSVTVIGNASANNIVRAPRGRSPLLVTMQEGKGKVTFVALDLVSQLVNIHPGAHRLLANLVSTR